ncbi:hypothetical protein NMG60_11024500 [Bertholletia excelsa]
MYERGTVVMMPRRQGLYPGLKGALAKILKVLGQNPGLRRRFGNSFQPATDASRLQPH